MIIYDLNRLIDFENGIGCPRKEINISILSVFYDEKILL